MSEPDFQTQVLRILSDVASEVTDTKVMAAQTAIEVKNVVSRLDRQHESIITHERELAKIHADMARRQDRCQLVDDASKELRGQLVHITSFVSKQTVINQLLPDINKRLKKLEVAAAALRSEQRIRSSLKAAIITVVTAILLIIYHVTGIATHISTLLNRK